MSLRSRHRGAWTGAAAIALLVSTCLTAGSGCSLAFTRGPPERLEPHQPVKCTKSYALPVLDGLFAASQVIRILYAVSLTDADYHGMALDRPTDIGLGVGLGVLSAISMAVGVSRVGHCNELLEAIERAPPPRPRPRPFKLTPPAPEEEDEEDVARARAAAAEAAKAAGEAARASQPKAAPPTATPPAAPHD